MTSNGRSGSTREALLRAAREELVEKGHAAVSLRAVARRAGVSHAAPAHFFGDRASMLTGVATEGFVQLADALDRAAARAAAEDAPPLEALGRAYVDFGLENPALVDLMFRRSELDADDAALVSAQRAALGQLRAAVADAAGAEAEEWSLISWAVVHGLVTLVREGVLARIAEKDPEESAALAQRLVGVYGEGVAAMIASHR